MLHRMQLFTAVVHVHNPQPGAVEAAHKFPAQLETSWIASTMQVIVS